MSTTTDNLQAVNKRLTRACLDSGRARDGVRLLAVSKTKPASQVEECYALGQRAFGENYLQDALEKITALQHLSDIEWHFIGPLQSNKTRPVAEHFHWLETLDREKIARRLNDQRPQEQPPLNVLIQINISGEAQKSGVLPSELPAFAALVSELPGLRLRGLMCIPEASDDTDLLTQRFQAMRALWQQLHSEYPDIDTLSMGMSADLELAIANGSTEVRIGTDIFGARDVRPNSSEEST